MTERAPVSWAVLWLMFCFLYVRISVLLGGVGETTSHDSERSLQDFDNLLPLLAGESSGFDMPGLLVFFIGFSLPLILSKFSDSGIVWGSLFSDSGIL